MGRNRYWFKPKHYGYGAYPITWEGWLTVILFIFMLFMILIYLSFNTYVFFAGIVLWIIVITYISKMKTDGDWKWSWGRKNNHK